MKEHIIYTYKIEEVMKNIKINTIKEEAKIFKEEYFKMRKTNIHNNYFGSIEGYIKIYLPEKNYLLSYLKEEN